METVSFHNSNVFGAFELSPRTLRQKLAKASRATSATAQILIGMINSFDFLKMKAADRVSASRTVFGRLRSSALALAGDACEFQGCGSKD
jgi:hypothetical protein